MWKLAEHKAKEGEEMKNSSRNLNERSDYSAIDNQSLSVKYLKCTPQNHRGEVQSTNPVCEHPVQHQIEDSGHVWQYCRGKNCHRKLFVRDI